MAVALSGDAHVANQHVRKTLSGRFPHSAPIPTGFVVQFSSDKSPLSGGLRRLTGII